VCVEGIKWPGVKVRADDSKGANLCAIGADEMSIRPKYEYDKGLDCYLGCVSSEIARDEAEAKQKADHVLTLVARGLTSHWKQNVGYVFTGSSFDARKMWEYVVDVMRVMYQEGIVAKVFSSDMGPTMVALWNYNGIRATREGFPVSAPHPVIPEERLYFAADEGHLLKNTWGQLLRTNFVLPADVVERNNLPGNVVERNNLPGNVVDIGHVRKLFVCQKSGGGKLEPELRKEHLQPGQCDTMDVRLASSLFSERMSSALGFAVYYQSQRYCPTKGASRAAI